MIRVGIVVVATASVLVLSACTGTPKPLSARGSVMVATDTYFADEASQALSCEKEVPREFSDIHGGSQVVVTNSDGKTIGVGALRPGKVANDDSSCEFTFDIPDIPAGSDFYGVHVGNTERNIFQVKASKLNNIAMALG